MWSQVLEMVMLLPTRCNFHKNTSPSILSNPHHLLALHPLVGLGEVFPFIRLHLDQASTWQGKHYERTQKMYIWEESWVVFLKKKILQSTEQEIMCSWVVSSSRAAHTLQLRQHTRWHWSGVCPDPSNGVSQHYKRATDGGRDGFSTCVYRRWKNSLFFFISWSCFSQWDVLVLALCFEQW